MAYRQTAALSKVGGKIQILLAADLEILFNSIESGRPCQWFSSTRSRRLRMAAIVKAVAATARHNVLDAR
jgi:hypothetical protein